MNTLEIVVQGSFLNIFGIGTLITGKQGIGKSELALSLISRGHQFIADDAPLFSFQKEKIIGRNPLKGHFISIRGIEIIDVFILFGPNSINDHCSLELIIQLEERKTQASTDLLGETSRKDVLGRLIPSVTIPIIMPRNLDILVETIVKNHLLKKYKEITSMDTFNELLSQKMDTNLS